MQSNRLTLYLAVAMGLSLLTAFSPYLARLVNQTPLNLTLLALDSLVIGQLAWPTLKKAAVELGKKKIIAEGLLAFNLLMIYLLIGWQLLTNWPRVTISYLAIGLVGVVIDLVGRTVMQRSTQEAHQLTNQLINQRPKNVRRVIGKTDFQVSIDEVKSADILLIRPGDFILFDGEIVKGAGVIDESTVTSAGLPTDKTIGDPVWAGTKNQFGSFLMKVSHQFSNPSLASWPKSPRPSIPLVADQLAGLILIATVIFAIAISTILPFLSHPVSLQLNRLELGVLLLTTLTTPVVTLATRLPKWQGYQSAKQRQIIVKEPLIFELGGQLKTIVFDKTGTLTMVKPSVTKVIVAPTSIFTPRQVLGIAASANRLINHPIAQAIVEKASEEKVPLTRPTSFQLHSGQGVEAVVNRKTIYLGNQTFMNQHNITVTPFRQLLDDLSFEGKRPVIVAADQKALGLIVMADQVKPDSIAAVDELRRSGIDILMFSGDQLSACQKLGRELKIVEVYGGLGPFQKAAKLQEFMSSSQLVAMVGDGLNDVPALKIADVGIAVYPGNDQAVVAAKVVVAKHPTLIVAFVTLARQVREVINQNLFFSLLLPILTVIGLIAMRIKVNEALPMVIILSQITSALALTLNSRRLSQFDQKSNRLH